MDCKDHIIISRYVNQFGTIRGRGRWYLREIVTAYVENDFQPEYSRYVLELCQRRGIRPAGARQTIRRYLQKSWREGFSWEWRRYVGWAREEPPQADAAIRVLCEQYRTVYRTYQEFLERGYGYYMRIEVERADGAGMSRPL